MTRKEQYADEIIEMLERTKCGAWVSNINLNTKDRVIEVCQNVVDSWSGRKHKDHCTTSPQAIEQTRWIPVSERLPEDKTYVLVTIAVRGRQPHSRSSWYQTGAFHNDNGDYWRADEPEVVAWMPLPEPYKAEKARIRNE